jgi:hypothetical protein
LQDTFVLLVGKTSSCRKKQKEKDHHTQFHHLQGSLLMYGKGLTFYPQLCKTQIHFGVAKQVISVAEIDTEQLA